MGKKINEILESLYSDIEGTFITYLIAVTIVGSFVSLFIR
jgi:hypothetical protein